MLCPSFVGMSELHALMLTISPICSDLSGLASWIQPFPRRLLGRALVVERVLTTVRACSPVTLRLQLLPVVAAYGCLKSRCIDITVVIELALRLWGVVFETSSLCVDRRGRQPF